MVRWSVTSKATHAWLILAVLLCSLLSGCTSDPAQDEDDHGDSPDGRPGNGNGANGEEPTAEDRNATLEEPPRWTIGQWWDVRVTSAFGGDQLEARLSVAGIQDDAYLIGVDEGGYLDELLVLHLPGIGKIRKTDLAWDVHDEMFQPVKFPLQEGDTWRTVWSGAEGEITVKQTSGLQAQMEFISDTDAFNGTTLTYDAEVAHIIEMDVPGLASMQVIGHGTGHNATVIVPYEYDLVIYHGRLAGVLGIGHQDGEAHPPTQSVSVSGDYDRASFVLLAFALTPGHYLAEAITPHGEEYQVELLATGPEQVAMEIHQIEDPTGDWETTYLTTGVGVVLIEVFAYNALEFKLPEGCLISGTANVQQPSSC
jgi:hypothetical protein